MLCGKRCREPIIQEWSERQGYLGAKNDRGDAQPSDIDSGKDESGTRLTESLFRLKEEEHRIWSWRKGSDQSIFNERSNED